MKKLIFFSSQPHYKKLHKNWWNFYHKFRFFDNFLFLLRFYVLSIRRFMTHSIYAYTLYNTKTNELVKERRKEAIKKYFFFFEHTPVARSRLNVWKFNSVLTLNIRKLFVFELKAHDHHLLWENYFLLSFFSFFMRE